MRWNSEAILRSGGESCVVEHGEAAGVLGIKPEECSFIRPET
jgi:hypothetical protein